MPSELTPHQPKPFAEVQDRHDFPAQVDDTFHKLGRLRNLSDFHSPVDFLDDQNIQGKFLGAQLERDQLQHLLDHADILVLPFRSFPDPVFHGSPKTGFLSRGTAVIPGAHTMFAISPAILLSGTILSTTPLSTTAFGMP